MPFETRTARVRDGSAVPYVEQGDPTGAPVLLVHAYADSWRSFEPVLPRLAQSHHVFALTQRGHGDAEKPSGGYALADLAAELASFLDAVGVVSAVIVGASSGGYVAQRFALDFPERTLGLVLVGSPRSLTDPPAVVAAIAELEDPVDQAFVREFVLATSSDRVSDSFRETMIGESSKVPAHVWRAALAGLVEAEPPTDTGAIAAPTLILWGEEDEFLPRAGQEELAAAIPDSRLVVLPGVGHAVHWEVPERVAVELSAFVAGLG